MINDNARVGSSFDDLLRETGDLSEANIASIKRVVAWQVSQKMKDENISKTRMAELIQIDQSALEGLLDQTDTSLTLHTLSNAAKVIGKTLQIKLI